MKTTQTYFRIITALSFFGIFVTAYLLYQHYKPAGGAFCNISEYVSCDIVNKSIYAEIFGIPFALIGFGAYLFFFVSALFYKKIRSRLFIPFLTLMSAGGLLIALYLTFVEFFILQAICILCITQQILILLIFLTFCMIWFTQRKSPHSAL